MEWLHIFIQELGIVKCEFFAFLNFPKRHDIQSIISAVRIATMILRRPFCRIGIPDNKNFFAYWICITAEVFFIVLIPILHCMATGDETLWHFFTIKNNV